MLYMDYYPQKYIELKIKLILAILHYTKFPNILSMLSLIQTFTRFFSKNAKPIDIRLKKDYNICISHHGARNKTTALTQH